MLTFFAVCSRCTTSYTTRYMPAQASHRHSSLCTSGPSKRSAWAGCVACISRLDLPLIAYCRSPSPSSFTSPSRQICPSRQRSARQMLSPVGSSRRRARSSCARLRSSESRGQAQNRSVSHDTTPSSNASRIHHCGTTSLWHDSLQARRRCLIASEVSRVAPINRGERLSGRRD